MIFWIFHQPDFKWLCYGDLLYWKQHFIFEKIMMYYARADMLLTWQSQTYQNRRKSIYSETRKETDIYINSSHCAEHNLHAI